MAADAALHLPRAGTDRAVAATCTWKSVQVCGAAILGRRRDLLLLGRGDDLFYLRRLVCHGRSRRSDRPFRRGDDRALRRRFRLWLHDRLRRPYGHRVAFIGNDTNLARAARGFDALRATLVDVRPRLFVAERLIRSRGCFGSVGCSRSGLGMWFQDVRARRGKRPHRAQARQRQTTPSLRECKKGRGEPVSPGQEYRAVET